MRLINHILRMWRHKVQSDLQLKQQSMRTPEIKFASISRRHLLTETNHVGERPSIQGLQEGNLDVTRSFISPLTNARVKKSLSYVKAGALENKKIGDLEDGVQYYAAKNSSCDYIVTYNQKDFFFSQLEVLLPEEMLGKCVYLIKNKKK